jgi:hypothetical protein
VTDLDQTYDEIKDKLNADREWEGEFFPSTFLCFLRPFFPSLSLSRPKHRIEETKRVNGLIGASPTYTRTQAMNLLFQSLCAELLTTRSTFWWGDTRKESVSKPYVTAAVAIQIGPGAKAQQLHGDSYVNHRVRDENQFLAIPREIVKTFDRQTQEFIGYYISEPACGHVEQMDPIYVLYPELLGSGGSRDFCGLWFIGC